MEKGQQLKNQANAAREHVVELEATLAKLKVDFKKKEHEHAAITIDLTDARERLTELEAKYHKAHLAQQQLEVVKKGKLQETNEITNLQEDIKRTNEELKKVRHEYVDAAADRKAPPPLTYPLSSLGQSDLRATQHEKEAEMFRAEKEQSETKLKVRPIIQWLFNLLTSRRSIGTCRGEKGSP
jgi:hypothetical protein